MSFHNLARETTTTTGTASVVLSGAVPGFNTFENAGVTNSETVHYGIITYDLVTHRPTHSEVGSGVYTTADNTLTRATVESSTNSGNKIVLTGLSEVFITPSAADLNGFGGGGSSFAVYQSTSSDSLSNTATVNPLKIGSEVVDADGLFALADNVLTCGQDGWYEFTVQVDAFDADDFGNGYYDVWLETGSSTTPTYMPYLVVHTTADASSGELYHVLAGPVALTASDTVQFGAENYTGGTITIQLMNILVKRLGDIPS